MHPYSIFPLRMTNAGNIKSITKNYCMIDTHCHLNFHAFKDDVENVIKETQTAGVTTIINTGTKLDSSQSAVDLAKQYDNLYAIVGIHPHHADKLENGWEETLKHIAKQEKVVAIGEIGLDYFSY